MFLSLVGKALHITFPGVHATFVLCFLGCICERVFSTAPHHSTYSISGLCRPRELKPPSGWVSRAQHVATFTRGGASEEQNDDTKWLRVENVAEIDTSFSSSVSNEKETLNESVTQTYNGREKDDGDHVPGPLGKEDTNLTKSITNFTFSATRPGDGSDVDPDGLPKRFLEMQKGHRQHAKEAFAATLAWRKDHLVDTILSRPHPHFDICKAIAPHYFPGRDANGHPIFVQRIGKTDLERLHQNNLTLDDLVMHLVYVIEYCWNILEPNANGIMTNILDLSGLSWRTIQNREYIAFAKRSVQLMSAHYPGRSYKTLIINAPKWFLGLYKIFRPLLRESTKQKIEIMKAGPEQEAALRFYLGEESLPEELMSSHSGKVQKKEHTNDSTAAAVLKTENSTAEKYAYKPGPHSEIEQEMRLFCTLRLEDSGTEMQALA